MMAQLFDTASVKLSDLRIRPLRSKAIADNLLQSWTEFGEVQGWRVAFVLEAGTVVYGLATWGRPVARLEDQETTLQLTRIALSPNAPPRAEVLFLAAMETWIHSEMPEICRLITYTDFREESGEMFSETKWAKQVLGVSGATWSNRDGRQGNERPSKVKYTKVLRRD